MRIALVAALATLAAAAPAGAQAPAPDPTTTPTPAPSTTPVPVTPAPTPVPTERVVPAGVIVSGIDLSGQTRDQAIASLQPLKEQVKAPVELSDGDTTKKLSMKRIDYALNIAKTVKRAMRAEAGTVLTPASRFDRDAVRTFIDAYADAVAIAPEDATVRITVNRIFTRPGKKGRGVKVRETRRAVFPAIKDPSLERTFEPSTRRVDPAVGRRDLKSKYPTIITVDQSDFRARLYRNLKFLKSYPVAVGQPAYPTPNGLFSITSMQVNPTWTVPNSPWAGELQGQSVSGSDPSNPLKARWLGVTNGVGFHGTGEDYSVGTAASHGCMRMHVSDVIDLYNRVSVGTPVLIHA